MKNRLSVLFCLLMCTVAVRTSYAQPDASVRLGEPSTPIIAIPSGNPALTSEILTAGGCPIVVDTKGITDFNLLRDLSASIDGFAMTEDFEESPDSLFLKALADRNVPIYGHCPELERINRAGHRLPDNPGTIDKLIAGASTYKHAKQLMSRIISLDSHCDQPVGWSRGSDIGVRNSTQVSLQKLWEGGGDAIFYVAFLGQKATDSKSQAIAAAKCEKIIDGIIAQAAKYPDYCGIARNSQDLKELKSLGKKSIFIGVENAYGIGDNLKLIKRYADKGVTYMTLSHSGDNAVCGSSSPSKDGSPKRGLTAYGRKVVEELNRCGILIDLSHTSDSTFWQTLELSKSPVVCTHSGARALYNHDRNITDDMLKALADKDGVIQIVAYGHFLRSDSENATIEDFMKHLQHCIKVAGIDHVGIGLDFDGGAGVYGLNGANDYINITVRLVKAGYSDAEIAKIWGGNFLRALDKARSIAETSSIGL